MHPQVVFHVWMPETNIILAFGWTTAPWIGFVVLRLQNCYKWAWYHSIRLVKDSEACQISISYSIYRKSFRHLRCPLASCLNICQKKTTNNQTAQSRGFTTWSWLGALWLYLATVKEAGERVPLHAAACEQGPCQEGAKAEHVPDTIRL